jgi:Cu/Ag efflux protein CusF
MKTLSLSLAVLLSAVLSPASYSQPQLNPASALVAASPANMTDGEIRKIDKEAKKITMKHGEIKNLDMPGMTMVFQVKDVALLGSIKVGDKVKFHVEKADGAIVVTDIQLAK